MLTLRNITEGFDTLHSSANPAEDLPTLYELCLERTARLLKNSYWDAELPISQNPFAVLPLSIIDVLLISVNEISKEDEPVLSSHLRLLLTSGRVTEFKLSPHNVNAENFHKMLMDLSASCRCLTSVEFYPPRLPTDSSCNFRDAIHRLLSEAQNIKHVLSCIEFDLRTLCNSVRLEKLVLYFQFRNNIQDFLEINGQFKPRPSFKHLQVFLTCRQDISYLDMAVLLKYCEELVSVDWDISEALEYLHAEALHNGSLSHRYKIQKCVLGIGLGSVYQAATRDGLLIASLTCPYLQDLRIFINDDIAISGLSNCQTLSTLEIICEPRLSGKYNLGLRSLLEKPEIGHNLKRLKLNEFTEVDFSSIGMCCPNLEVLSGMNVNEETLLEYSPTSFRKLQNLDFFDQNSDVCKRDTLVGMLSNAVNLNNLKLEPARELTDDVLKDILRNNNLSNLKRIYISECGLSLFGWRKLARSLTALQDVDLWMTENSEEIASVVREINPEINVD